jgi:hypothetical protein
LTGSLRVHYDSSARAAVLSTLVIGLTRAPMVGHAAADNQQSETAMDGFKRFVMGVAGVGMLAAGLSLVPSDAEAFKCVRSWIPFGDPTGVECARSCAAVAAYRLDATPQTIVLSNDGRVERVWQGAYAGRQHAAIQDYFGVTLPEVPVSSR